LGCVNAILKSLSFSGLFQLDADPELRDRWLEQVNGEPALLAARGQYEVERAIGRVSMFS
jgi:hypothetical protein